MKSLSIALLIAFVHVAGLYALAGMVGEGSSGVRATTRAKEAPRKPASSGEVWSYPKGPKLPDLKTGQGELMLNRVREPKPSFLRKPASNVVWGAVCRSPYGTSYDASQDPRGYERCMDLKERSVGAGAATFIPRR